jgi:type IV pilus assembly protein PilA
MARSEDHRSGSGFTLIELLVVVVVVGILASIALSAFLDHRRKGWDAAVESDLRNAATVQHTVLTVADEFAISVGALEAAGFRPSPAVNYFGGSFAMTVTAVGSTRFCLTAQSASGLHIGYLSGSGVTRSPDPMDEDTCD